MVHLDDGSRWRCRLRGRLKRGIGRVMVGDRVWVTPTDTHEGWIESVDPRGVILARPMVANVRGLVVVFSPVDPMGSLDLLDRRLVTAELLGLRSIIAVSKSDMRANAGRPPILDPWASIYPIVWTSARTGQGLDTLVQALDRGVWVLSGESGAGKSSLIRALVPGADVGVQGLSRIGRGRQTTRVVSLYRLGEAWVADTPGFTRLELPDVTPEQLLRAFPELAQARCRFRDCRHVNEIGCGVEDLLERGIVSPIRLEHYRHYLKNLGPA